MARTVSIFLIFYFCFYNSRQKIISELDLPTVQTKNIQDCKKCDKKIIELAEEKWNKLNNNQVEQFLCSFSKTCDLKQKYKNGGSSYQQTAFEMLIVQLHLHLDTCTRLFDTNKNIEFEYILTILGNAVGYDLPYPSIISQLQKKANRTATEEKILKALEQSENLKRGNSN